MRFLVVAAVSLMASAAMAHEAPPATQPTSSPASAPAKAIVKPVKGHSGGTDAAGCHTNSQTGDYHCHRPK